VFDSVAVVVAGDVIKVTKVGDVEFVVDVVFSADLTVAVFAVVGVAGMLSTANQVERGARLVSVVGVLLSWYCGPRPPDR
jgi:hypothetical protein